MPATSRSLTPTELEYLIVCARDGGLSGPDLVCSPVWQGYWDRAQDILLAAQPKPRPCMKFHGLLETLTAGGYFADYVLTQLGWDTSVETCATVLLANGVAQLPR